ncbi:tRNA(His) guanylyltransferase Thg1 family protein [Celerinatantimonas sp. YJH-8]|uniref:tRNA(His) guanylyltransferase Thg1 family protein n=1 Tax=Celerinatantimonas sp. YJH-8 TaxID=3228714 RepID=UPI0038C15D74
MTRKEPITIGTLSMEQQWYAEREWVRRYSVLHPCFSRRQERCERFMRSRAESYMVVRLDGIDMSRRFLKNGLFHERFDKCLHRAVLQALNDYCADSSGSIMVMCCSDEVSLIESRPNALGADSSLFKMISVLASLLTYYFNANAHRMPWRRLGYQGGFDARPIQLLNKLEINNYIGYRLALYQRNTLTKLLRLKKVPASEIYREPFYNHIDYLFEKSVSVQDYRELSHYIQQPAFCRWPNKNQPWFHLQTLADFDRQLKLNQLISD